MSRLGSLLVALVSAACGGGQSSGVPVASKQIETVPRAPESDARPAHLISSARATLQYLPKDVDTVAHFDWRKIRGGMLYGHEPLTSLQEELLPFREKCGLNLLERVDTVTVGLTGKSDPDESFIAVVGGDIKKSDVETCLLKLGAPMEAGHFVLAGDEFNLLWVAEGVLLVSRKVLAADMQARLNKGTLLEAPELMQWIRKTDSHAEVWGAAAGEGVLFEGLRSLGGGPEGLYLNVEVDDTVAVFVSIQFQKADGAQQVESLVRAINGSPRPSNDNELQLDTIDVRRDGRRLDVVIKVNPPKIAAP